MEAVAAPHALERGELARALKTDPERGLDPADAAERLIRFGPNRPRRVRRPPYVRLAVNQFLDPLVALLVGATAVSFAIGDTIEAIAIAAVLVVNAVLGFWQEAIAERAILALSQAFTQSAIVVRGGFGHRDQRGAGRSGRPPPRPGGRACRGRRARARGQGARARRVGLDRRVSPDRQAARAGRAVHAARRAQLDALRRLGRLARARPSARRVPLERRPSSVPSRPWRRPRSPRPLPSIGGSPA